jgi:hypothetical protein
MKQPIDKNTVTFSAVVLIILLLTIVPLLLERF